VEGHVDGSATIALSLTQIKADVSFNSTKADDIRVLGLPA
jgi:hypothetical protein